MFVWHPVSEVARFSLITSRRTLAHGANLDRGGSGLPNRAFHDLARCSCVGAAQAVWILASVEASERRERGLTLIHEMYRKLPT